MKKIRKAVIPAAGFGTRMLPASKAIPKEMTPVFDKPAIEYIVEEAALSGITDILIITSRGKEAIEAYFDRMPELEAALLRTGKTDAYEAVLRPTRLASITYLRQGEARGLGHAVGLARAFVGDEPFAVLYGDDLIVSKRPVTAQLIEAYEKYGCSVVGVKEVAQEVVMRGSSLRLRPLEGNVSRCTDMIEKPESPELLMSSYTILGRCLLTPEIFDIIDSTPPGAGGEIQLTDAMAALARRGCMTAVDFEGTRYDMGSRMGALEAGIEAALRSESCGKAARDYILRLADRLRGETREG